MSVKELLKKLSELTAEINKTINDFAESRLILNVESEKSPTIQAQHINSPKKNSQTLLNKVSRAKNVKIQHVIRCETELDLQETSGLYYKSTCCFCWDQTKNSLTVSPEKQIFYCFSCHEGGDVVQFIVKSYKIDLESAADYIIKKYLGGDFDEFK